VVCWPDALLALAPDEGGVYEITIGESQWRSDQRFGRRRSHKLKPEGRGWSATGGAGEWSQPVSPGRLAGGTDGIWTGAPDRWSTVDSFQRLPVKCEFIAIKSLAERP
jgi:hypothetical protein